MGGESRPSNEEEIYYDITVLTSASRNYIRRIIGIVGGLLYHGIRTGLCRDTNHTDGEIHT